MSCEVCDTAFYWICEHGWAADQVVQEAHDIRCWVRYRDDIIVLYGNFDLFQVFINELKRRLAGIWTIKIEEVSAESVTMLDLTVCKSSTCSGYLKWRPYFKPSSRAVPLSTSSHHHNGVHGWPAADLCRLARNSSTLSDFEHAKLFCIKQLMGKHHDPSRILDMMASHPFNNNMCKPSFFLTEFGSQSLCSLSLMDSTVLTIVLTHHPSVNSSSLGSRTRALCAEYCSTFSRAFLVSLL